VAIMTAAVETVRNTDIDEITVRAVAARAGVAPSSLYDYFRDRRSLFARVAAVITEENLASYERLLASVAHLPLREFIDALAGHTLSLYTTDLTMPRSILKLCYRIGLVPMLAEGQRLFAQSLARALRQRNDVGVLDIEAAAFVITQSSMGLVHTMIWEHTPTYDAATLRVQSVDMICRYLAGESGAPFAKAE
jgi:AcrR family transcriptional regulator